MYSNFTLLCHKTKPFLTFLVFFAAFFMFKNVAFAQRMTVHIVTSSITTTCTDGFIGGAPDPRWHLEVAGQGYSGCQNNGANNFDIFNGCVPASVQPGGTVQICVRFFEDDANIITGCGNGNRSCEVAVCQNYTVPASGVQSPNYVIAGAGSSTGSVTFYLTYTAIPNDNICSAAAIAPNNVQVNGNNDCATVQAGEVDAPNPTLGPNVDPSNTVWYQFTAPANGRVRVSTDHGNTNFDTEIALWQGSNAACTFNTLSFIDSDDDIVVLINDNSRIDEATCLLPGTRCYVQVDGDAGGETGNFGLTVENLSGAGPAPNNFVCNAIDLGTLPTTGTIGNFNLSNYTNFCANNVGEPSPGWITNGNDQGVWFKFTTNGNPSAQTRIEAKRDPQNFGDNIDLQLALYRVNNATPCGTTPTFTEIDRSYIPLGDEDIRANCLAPNTTYYILVDGYRDIAGILGGEEGYFGLQVSGGTLVRAGDQICDAQSLGAVPTNGVVQTANLSQTNVCATDTNDPTPSRFSSEQGVWYSFLAPASGSVRVEATSDAIGITTDPIDLQLAIYETANNLCTGTLTEFQSEYDPILFDEEMKVRCLVPNRRYWLFVDGSNITFPVNIQQGIFGIKIFDDQNPPAPNDEACNAIALGAPTPGNPVSINNQNNYCADNIQEPIPAQITNENSVWYTFVAPPSGTVNIKASNRGALCPLPPCEDAINLQIAVFDRAANPCNPSFTFTEMPGESNALLGIDFPPLDETYTVSCLTPGQIYYVLIDGQGNLLSNEFAFGKFDLEIRDPGGQPAASNDLLCDAIPLGNPDNGLIGTVTGAMSSPHTQNNYCATSGAPEPDANGITEDQTVWYSFVAPLTTNVHITIETDDLGCSILTPNTCDWMNVQAAVFSSSDNTCNGVLEEVNYDAGLLNIPPDWEADVPCLIPGNTYFVMIQGSSINNQGHFDIQIEAIPMRPFPPNDLICSATALGNVFVPGGVTLQNQSNLCADNPGDPTPSAFGTDHTVWYSFTTPTGAPSYAVQINAESASINPLSQAAVDLQLAVYSSSNNTCNGTLSEVVSEYDLVDFPIFGESMDVQCLEPNRTYFIMVDGSFNLLSEGNFSINVQPLAAVPIAPNNDRCQAISLGTLNPSGTIGSMATSYSNFCSDTESGEPSPFSIDRTVWFSFTTPNGGANMTYDAVVRVNNDPNNLGNGINSQLAVYEVNGGCVGTYNLLGDSDNLVSYNSEVELECLNANTTYYLQVDGESIPVINAGGDQGYFGITVQGTGSGPRPAYDNRCNAVALGTVPNGGTLNNGTIYNNYCATTENGEPTPNAFGIDKTVWFSFVAPTSGNVTIRTDSDPTNLGDDIDLQVAIYAAPAGCNGAMIELESEYDGAGLFFDEDVSVECLRAGTTYYVQIDGSRALNEDSQGYFNITIEDDGGTTNAPYNDDVCNAYNFGLLGPRQTRSNENNTCASVQLGEPGLGGYATNTVWYSFIAPPSGRANIHVHSIDGALPFSGVDTEVHLVATSNNTCTGTLTDIQSSYFPSSLIDEQIDADCLVPGNTYFVQVDGAGLITQGNFDIWVEDAIPNYAAVQPANNEPCNATVLTVQQQACFVSGGVPSTFNYGNPTVSMQATCNANDNCGDIWYSFTMPSNGLVTVRGDDDNISANPIGDFSNMHVNAYTGTCGALTPLTNACTSGGQGFPNDPDPYIELSAPPGSTVWLQVFGDGQNDFGDDFQLCVSQSCGADACANAIPMTPGVPYCWSTGEMGTSGADYPVCGQTSAAHTLYFSFQSDCNGDSLTLSLIGATIGGSCILGNSPTDAFSLTLFEDATPCDGLPTQAVDCQPFNKCQYNAPFNWSRTYTNLLPNTSYTLMINGGGLPVWGGGSNFGQVMITARGNPRVALTNTPIICAGSTSTLTATTQGGAAPHTFNWSTGTNTGTTNTLSGVAAGIYTVTATDSRGCTGSTTITVVDTTNIILLTATQTAPATCFNSSDGVATATATGGEGGFTYAWDTGAVGAIMQPPFGGQGGIHTVTATDLVGCTKIATVTITAPAALVLIPSIVTPISCNNGTNAVLTVAVTGGTAPYTYLWDNADATATTTNPISVGTHTVIVTDAALCNQTATINVVNPTPILATAVLTSEPLCNLGFTGVGTASATGGAPPYTYMWDAGNLTNPINNALGAGLHIVTVTDALNCTGLASFTMTEPTAILATAVETTPVTCFNGTNGVATASATGGIAPYTYLWDVGTPNNTTINNNLNAGTHTVTITDANACQKTAEVVITEPAAILATAVETTPATCFGGTNGVGTAAATGGIAPYTYLWDLGTPNNTAVNNNLNAGVHSVIVTDANSCSTIVNVTISQATAVVATATQTTPVLCFGGVTGVATTSATGGTGTYTYLWDAGTPNSNAINNNLGAGLHTVIVTDANTCTGIGSVTITEPTLLSATATANTAALCVGASNGSATAVGAGGVAPYTYTWDTGVPNNTATNTNLNAGTHTVTVTDANLCSIITTVNILDPTPLVVTATLDNNVSCFGNTNGAATALATGGATPYIYTWDSPFTGASANNLNAGSHVVSVTDANNCVATTTIAITEPALLSLSAIQDAAVLCFGQANGTATATATDGTAPYVYTWDSPFTGASANNLNADNHQVTVTDANNCLAVANIIITQPIALSASILLNNNVLCNGENTGSATASGIDGTAPYQYLWDDNTTTTATNVTLNVGSHTVLVTDASGCTKIATITIIEPTALSASITNTNSHCGQGDGTATVSGAGATAPYTYLWEDNTTTTATITTLLAGVHTVIVTDANLCSTIVSTTITDTALPVVATQTATNPTCNGLCNGAWICVTQPLGGTYTYLFSDPASTTNTTGNLPNICAGTYTVTATDAFGCTATASETLTEPALLVATISNPINPLCARTPTGSATASATGGTAAYSFVWDSPFTGATPNNLDANTHTVTVTDANACTATAEITLTDPAGFSVATNVITNVACAPNSNGSASATVAGGTGTITYAWSSGSPLNPNWSSTQGLAAGIHTVTATDANGCTATNSVTIITLPALQVNMVIDNPIDCAGNATGAVTALVVNGTGVYTVIWSNNEIIDRITGLSAGVYTITVNDANGCTTSATVNLQDPPAIQAAITVNGASICGGATGSATANILAGGVTPFAFAWSNGITNAINTTLPAGLHFVTVTDASGCSVVASCQITQNSTLAATITTTPISCFGNTNGTATVNAIGGSAPYTYLWDNTSPAPTIGGLVAGIYTVIATDALNCSVIAAVTLTEPDVLNVAIANFTNTTCSANNGSASVNVLGGTPTYTYAWDNLVQTATVNTLDANLHTVTVTDANACSATAEVTITADAPLRVTVVPTRSASCNQADGAAAANGLSGTLPYSFAWSSPLPVGSFTGPLNSNLTAGTHFVTITDATGCTATASVDIQNASGLAINLVSAVDVSCNNLCDGRATVLATGGTAPLTYLWTHNQATTTTESVLCVGIYTVIVTDGTGCTSQISFNITEPAQLAALPSVVSAASCGNNGVATAIATGGTTPYTFTWDIGTPQAIVWQTATNLSPGQHTLNVTDANGCTINKTLLMPQIAALRLKTFVDANVSCFGSTDGSATVSVINGVSPYTYIWDIPQIPSGPTAINLGGGTHTVTVTDAVGCVVTSNVSILSPMQLFVSATGVTAGCNGTIFGSAQAIANGGTQGYVFQWSNGPSGSSINALTPDTYTVTATDANGCVSTATVIIGDSSPASIDLVDIINPTCFGDTNGSITLTVSDGVPPLSYYWSNNTSGTGLAAIGAGRYTVTITDAIGCKSTTNIAVIQPLAITATTTLTRPFCIGDANGSITVTSVSNGVSPYLYGVDGSVGTQNNELTGLQAGSHLVVVTDVNGCTWQKAIVIPNPLPIAVTVNVDKTIALGDSLVLKPVVNSIAAVAYQWSPQAGLSCYNCRYPVAKPLRTTTYTVTVTDANGCTATDEITITVLTEKNVYIPNSFSPNNDGANDAFTAYGGNAIDKIQLMRIFDRWGELVYEGAELAPNDKGWDGTMRDREMNNNVFVYYIQVRFIDGEVLTFTGDVTMVR
jgi:large repetitive protein